MAQRRSLSEKDKLRGKFQLDSLLEHLNEGIYLLDPEGKLLDVSESLVKLFGYKRKEDLFATDIAKEIYLEPAKREWFLHQLKEKGKISQFEVSYRKKTGEVIHCLESAVAIKDAQGKITGYQGIIIDITEKKKLEEALRREKEYVENILFNAIPAAVFIVSPDRKIVKVNREFERLLGYRKEELIGKSCSILECEECLEHCGLFDPEIKKPVSGKEKHFFTKEGRRITVLRSIDLLRDENGNITGGIEALLDISEMKEAGERFKLFYQAISGSMDAICIADVDGRIIEVNEAFCEIWGYSKEEALKFRVADCWAPEQLDVILREVIPKTLKGGWTGELIGLRKNKERFIAELRSGSVRDEEGNVVAMLASSRDISDRKVLERESQLIQEINLRLNSGEELSRVIRMICEGARAIYNYHFFDLLLLSEDKKYLVYTYSTRPEALNAKIKEMTGLDLVGLKIPLSPGSKLRKVVLEKRPLFSNGIMEVTELVKDFTDRMELKPAASMIANLLGCDYIVNIPITAGGEVLGVVGIGNTKPLGEEDVIRVRGFLDQIGVALGGRKLEEEIARSKAYLENLIENMGEGLIVTDAENKVLLVNRMAEAILNIDGDELVGKSAYDCHKPETRKKVEAVIAKFKSESLEERHPYEMKIETGTKVIRGNIAPIYSEPQGEFLGVALLLQDITRLAEIDRMKTDFVSAVSHELRTPLASITGFASTILNDPEMDAETRNEFLKIILDEGKRLTRLIEDLLDIQKIETGRIPTKKVWFDFPDMCQDVVEKLKPQAEKKGIPLSLEVAPDIGKVFADPDQMKQVMINLITNAIKFTPEQGNVWIRVVREDGMIRVEVEDTGMGIPKDEIPRVFEKFHRVHRPSTQIQGTGLGLPIVKSIIEKHGGRIFIESEVGKGTKVIFLIPEKEEQKEKKEKASS